MSRQQESGRIRAQKAADTRRSRRGARKDLSDLARDPSDADGVDWVEGGVVGSKEEAYRWKEEPLRDFGSSEES